MFPLKATPLLTKKIYLPIICAHTKSCPVGGKKRRGKPPSEAGGSSSSPTLLPFKRQMKCDPVRLGFVPDNWFTFFHSLTGVTGPYIFIITYANYLFSKEIYVMEHEYYLGLSAFVMLTYSIKTFGKAAGDALDQEVKNVTEDFKKGRNDDIAHWQNVIKMGSNAQESAKAQKLLMDAKKENIALQLEAVTRERAMMVYVLVKGRMEYQMKRHMATNRIHQKWMLAWILQKVKASITPDFERQALDSAINDLAAAAQQPKK